MENLSTWLSSLMRLASITTWSTRRRGGGLSKGMGDQPHHPPRPDGLIAMYWEEIPFDRVRGQPKVSSPVRGTRKESNPAQVDELLTSWDECAEEDGAKLGQGASQGRKRVSFSDEPLGPVPGYPERVLRGDFDILPPWRSGCDLPEEADARARVKVGSVLADMCLAV